MASSRLDFDFGGGEGFIRRLIGRFFRSYRSRLNDALDEGTRTGVHDVMDAWKRESTDLAPLKTGDLRRSITTEVSQQNGKWSGEISASVITVRGGRRFDYASYLHDEYPQKYGDSFKHPTTPGTIPRYLEVPAEMNEAEWARLIEGEIKAALKRRRV